ncbi:alkaline phosphatase family protein, partial [candidate division KSB1 bacterium]
GSALSAALLGGRNPDGVFWYNAVNGTYISSSNYVQSYPLWLVTLNARRFPDRYIGTQWDRLLADERLYESRSRADLFPGETGGEAARFPYSISGISNEQDYYQRFRLTHGMDEYLTEIAAAVVKEQGLGTDENPDLLLLSYLGPDYIGNNFGPFSQEAMDAYLRIDVLLGKFMNTLDREIGLEDIVFVLTAGHGAAALPEYLNARNIDAERVFPHYSEQWDRINNALSEQYGEGKWIQWVNGLQAYLDRTLIEQRGLDYEHIESYVADQWRSSQVAEAVYTWSQLSNDEVLDDEYSALYANNFYADRSPDIIIRLKEHDLVSPRRTGTMSGSPYSYDTRVPLIFQGKLFMPGIFSGRVSTTGILPTLADLLGIPVPDDLDGQMLQAVFGADHE